MKHLLIELSENAVRFAASTGDALEKHAFFFKDKKDYRYKEQLDEFLIESGLKQQDFDECSISWSSKRSTLIPTNIFSESKPETLFHLCFGAEVTLSDIDYNRIPEQGLVNLFEIPLWVKSFFVIRYPRSVIQHEGSHLIRGMFSEASFKQKCVLLIYNDYFLLGIVKENKLQFYSVFDYQTNEDIIYHLMFTLQQKDFLKDVGVIQLYTGVGSNDQNINELMQKLQSLADFKKATITVNNDFIINSQKQCV